MTHRILTALLSLLLCPVFFNTAPAGSVTPELVQKLSGLDRGEKLEVLITLAERDIPATLKSTLYQSYKTGAERHRSGIARLKETAAATQTTVLNYLRRLENSGKASDIKSHWIINAVVARVEAGEIETLAALDDIDEIMQLPRITSIQPPLPDDNLSVKKATGVESNLSFIGADQAWAMGLTGEGRVVCIFDTGVDGLHPALFDSWKGHDGDSAAAWFDPFSGETFPHTIPEADGSMPHGTHVTGIAIGHDDITGDTIGVAPGAKWIAAAVIDLPYVSILDAFEWAADPDGDPNTFDDVPDVINHSWGIFNELVGCHPYFWEMIDNTEALGIINIFAAGNEGWQNFHITPMTIRNPANRAADSLNSFAVGALFQSGDYVWQNSSRGPSDCDSISIKPNVVAPGVSIRSSFPGGDYVRRSGTSMAAPHVSGAVAILRQHAPDATPDEIKEALLAGAVPYATSGDPVPNNDYGWGLINIPAAISYLTPEFVTELRIFSFNSSVVNPGETASDFVVVKNLGESIDNVYGKVTFANGGLTVLTDSLYFGTIDINDTASSHIEFAVEISDTVTPGRLLAVDFTLYGSGGYVKPTRLYIRAGESQHGAPAGFHTIENGRIVFTVTNFGQYGFGEESIFPLGYSGFTVDDGVNQLWEGSFMIAVDSAHVSDGARNFAEEPDNDFAVAPGGDIIVTSPGAIGDYETISSFTDDYAENPLGLKVHQKTYAWSYPYQQSLILEYEIENTSDSIISTIYAGLFFDWDLVYFTRNNGGYSPAERLGYMYYMSLPDQVTGDVDSSDYRGIAILNPEGTATYTLRVNPFDSLAWEERHKYMALTSGEIELNHGGRDDLSQIISTGPFSLESGQADTAVFAIVIGDNLDEAKAAALQANINYGLYTDIAVVDTEILPERLTLAQNYPNPFNPTTTISFGLNRRTSVRLDIFNILGEKVTTLADDDLAAGQYRLQWDGCDRAGRNVPSGIYLYRLKAGDESLTRKMMLLK